MFWFTFVLATILQQDEGGEVAQMLAIVRTAHEQQEADCASGRLQFRRHSVVSTEEQASHMEGSVEWDDDYLYFDGSFKEQWQGKVEGKLDMDVDLTQRFLRSGDSAVGWSKIKKVTIGSDDTVENSVRVFPFGRLNRTPLVRSTPDPRIFLLSRDGVYGFALDLVQPTPTTRQGINFKRTVAIEGSIVTVTCMFKPPVEHIVLFDLDQGAMCTESRDIHHYKEPVRYCKSRRKLAKTANGIWYPTEVRREHREGSESADPGTLLLEILKFEPLGHRTMAAKAGLNSFGKLPNGTYIHEMDSTGKSHTRELGAEEEPDLESLLQEQAKALRENAQEKEKK